MLIATSRLALLLTFGLGLVAATACGGAQPANAQPKANATRGGVAIQLTDRVVDYNGTVNMTMIKKARDKFLEFDRESHDPIWLRINSGGGSVEAGLILIDTFNAIESPVHCLVESKAYSMAAITLVFCDKKYALRHATIMLHEASYGTVGEDPSNRSRLDFLTRYLDRMHVEIAKAIKMPLDKYRAKIRDAWWMLADEALASKVIDGVVGEIDSAELTKVRTEQKETVTVTEKATDIGDSQPKIPKRR